LAGQTTSRIVTISNSGGIATSFNIVEVNAPAPPLGPTGPFAQRHRHIEPEGVNEPDALDAFGFHAPAGPILAAGGAVISWTTCPDFGTSERGLAFNPLSNSFYSGSFNDGILNHFDVTGALLDSTDLAIPISGLAFNPSTNHLFAMTNHPEVGGLDVYVYDTN